MGHALNGSIQDVLIRWHRMRGYDTLWQPGYDHAGISTQNVIEKQLVAEGTSRQEIGREAFLERTWRWLDETGRTIMGQYRRLGASLDYARERFTMDDGYVEAVMTFFVRLWDAGWIYRDEPDRQLVPVPPDGDLGPRGRARRDGRHAVPRPLPVRRRRGTGSRSRPSARRRSSPTSPSRCIPTTSATATRSGARSSCPSSSAACR